MNGCLYFQPLLKDCKKNRYYSIIIMWKLSVSVWIDEYILLLHYRGIQLASGEHHQMTLYSAAVRKRSQDECLCYSFCQNLLFWHPAVKVLWVLEIKGLSAMSRLLCDHFGLVKVPFFCWNQTLKWVQLKQAKSRPHSGEALYLQRQNKTKTSNLLRLHSHSAPFGDTQQNSLLQLSSCGLKGKPTLTDTNR